MPPGTEMFNRVSGFRRRGSSSVRVAQVLDGEYCRGCVDSMVAHGVVWEQPTLF